MTEPVHGSAPRPLAAALPTIGAVPRPLRPRSDPPGAAAAPGPEVSAAERTGLERAAREFESLFLSQLLRSMRSAGTLLGGEETAESGDTLLREVMDEQLATALARRGGLGLGKLLAARLVAERQRAVEGDDDPPAP